MTIVGKCFYVIPNKKYLNEGEAVAAGLTGASCMLRNEGDLIGCCARRESNCFWSLLTMYSCSCSRAFSRSIFSFWSCERKKGVMSTNYPCSADKKLVPGWDVFAMYSSSTPPLVPLALKARLSPSWAQRYVSKACLRYILLLVRQVQSKDIEYEKKIVSLSCHAYHIHCHLA